MIFILLTVLSAILIVTSSLVPPLCWLGFVAFIPALWALDKKATAKAWSLGGALLFFFVAIGAYYWVYTVAHYFGDLSRPLALLLVPIFGLLNIWQALVGFLLFAWLRDKVSVRPSLLFALSFSLAWHQIPAIFFWDISLLISGWLPFLQSLDLFGSFGLDFFILFFNYEMFLWMKTRRWNRGTFIALVLFLLNIGYGFWRIADIKPQLENAPKVTVTLIQPNIESREKINPLFIDQSLGTLLSLTDQAIRNHPTDLIVWPESVFPLPYRFDAQLQRVLKQSVHDWNADLFFGGNDYYQEGGEITPFNAAYFLNPGKEEFQVYHKHILLAFGEFLPFSDIFPKIREWFPVRIGNFGKGPGAITLSGKNYTFNPLICYESTQSDFIRANANLHSDFMVEISNDGWYLDTNAIRYHKELAKLRAIENRKGIVRTTNTGITNFFDPIGREESRLPIQTGAIGLALVPKVQLFSLFSSIGFWLKKLGLAFLIFFIFQARFTRR